MTFLVLLLVVILLMAVFGGLRGPALYRYRQRPAPRVMEDVVEEVVYEERPIRTARPVEEVVYEERPAAAARPVEPVVVEEPPARTARPVEAVEERVVDEPAPPARPRRVIEY